MKNTTLAGLNRRPHRVSNGIICRRGIQTTMMLLLAVLMSHNLFGQQYSVNTACSTPFDPINIPANQIAVNGDQRTYDLTMPFNFQFFGQSFITPTLRVSVGGYILFNASTGELSHDNATLPVIDGDINPGGGIFVHWDNTNFLDPNVGVYASTSGVAPNRTYTIQWYASRRVINESPLLLSNGDISFEVVFHESTNVIQYLYEDTYFGSNGDPLSGYEGNYGASATIGLQRGNGPETVYLTSYNNGALLSGTNCISFSPTPTTPSCTMGCNTTNIGLPADCQPVLYAKDYLTTNYGCTDNFIIELFATPSSPQPLESGVDSLKADGIAINGNPYPLINQTYVIRITENLAGGGNPQSCWNYHTFQDNLAPEVDCRNADTVFCYEPMILYSLDGITDCSGALTAHVLDSTFTPYTASDDPYLLGRLIRKYYLTDASGNASDTCTDTLFLAPPSFDSIVMPANVMNLQCDGTYPLDANGNPDPSYTGVPTIINTDIELYPNNFGMLCNLNTTYTDTRIPAGCNVKINRVWTMTYWGCCGDSTRSRTQTLMINDTVPPIVSAPPNVTIPAGNNCSSSYAVLPATITDNCNHIGNVTVIHPNGVTPTNGGFTVTNLSVGSHNIIYSVNDGCGHIVRDTTVVTVVDQTSPVPVCKDAIVSLDNTGVGRMFASSINNGSHDNGCGPVTFKVRRMNPDCNGLPDQTTWSDYLDFYCCDLANNPIPVILQVTDAAGLTSTCMTNVTVQNKNTPIVTFPLPTININCETTYDINNLSLSFGKYVTNSSDRDDIIIDGHNYGKDGLVTGVCTAIITELTPLIELSSCGFGKITRYFKITDGGSFQNTVSQVINITNVGYELTASDFNAPLDYVVNSGMCNPGDVANADLPAPYIPTLKNPVSSCHSLMFNKSDEVFTVASGACFKVVRTWTIIDWCLQEEKGMQYALNHAVKFTHAIIVMNTVAPTFAPHADQVVNTDNCSSDNVTVSTSATDDCPSSFLTFQWKVDFNFNNNTATWDQSGFGNSFTINMPLGHHRVYFGVTDGCGNKTDQFFFVDVHSVKKPSPVMKPLVADLMANWTVMLPARLFNHGSTGACPSSYPLRYSYSTNPADSVKTFDCSYGVDVPFPVAIYVIDNNGLYDFVYTTLTLNDNIVPCPDSLTTIGGSILTESSEGIPHVSVSALSGLMRQTDTNGNYRFTNLQPDVSYKIEPTDENNPMNGVTTGDIIKIQNHILNKTALTTPYKIIAADVNEDKSVTVSDIVMIRKLILGKIDQLSSGKSWKFIDKSYVFNNPEIPLKENYPQSIKASGDGSSSNLDFVGVKLGDVNGDFTLSLMDNEIESRSAAKVLVSDVTLKAGEVTPIYFSVSEGEAIQGLQAAFNLSKDVSFVGMESTVFSPGPDNYNLNGNVLKLSLNAENGEITNQLLTFFVVSNKDVKLSDVLSLNGEGIRPEMYDEYGNSTGFTLEFESGNGELVVEQNVPNPFNEETHITFTLAHSDEVTLKIYDVNGRILRQTQGYYAKGRNTITIENGTLHANGVLFYEITSNQKSITKKMVKLK